MQTACRRSLAVAIVILLAAWNASYAATLYVAPSGNDAWSGRLAAPAADRTDGPLATLAGARQAVRKLKAQGPLKEPVQILVADGEYAMSEPLVLTPADSGSATCPISYEAAPGAAPRFTGGRSPKVARSTTCQRPLPARGRSTRRRPRAQIPRSDAHR